MAKIFFRAWEVGSSPRVRGTRPIPIHPPQQPRFIPASAGNATARRPAAGRLSVHPRECGERVGVQSAPRMAYGSSPRVRGTRLARLTCRRLNRFIPASAGNAGNHRHEGPGAPVHPRECGERVQPRPIKLDRAGSSPRVRGTHPSRNCRIRSIRFIPASAGNAMEFQHIIPGGPVHPRECGERRHRPAHHNHDRGSSPRVRGTLKVQRQHGQGWRFIPASAGNAPWKRIDIPDTTVHPRECGERLLIHLDRLPRLGSSPRVRGTRTHRNHPQNPHTVHPRECGERRAIWSRPSAGSGSSPRVRGTHPPHDRWNIGAWFIPASAGNALPLIP